MKTLFNNLWPRSMAKQYVLPQLVLMQNAINECQNAHTYTHKQAYHICTLDRGMFFVFSSVSGDGVTVNGWINRFHLTPTLHCSL